MDQAQIETANGAGRDSMSDSQSLGWLLVAGGAVWACLKIVSGRHGLRDLLLPVGVTGAGIAILTVNRRERIDVAEQNILLELDGLDPIAKAQVLKAVTQQELRLKDSGKTKSRKGK